MYFTQVCAEWNFSNEHYQGQRQGNLLEEVGAIWFQVVWMTGALKKCVEPNGRSFHGTQNPMVENKSRWMFAVRWGEKGHVVVLCIWMWKKCTWCHQQRYASAVMQYHQIQIQSSSPRTSPACQTLVKFRKRLCSVWILQTLCNILYSLSRHWSRLIT